MSSYSPSKTDRAKGAAAAVAVNIALGAILLSGLASSVQLSLDETLKTFDVNQPAPPPVIETRPVDKASPEPDPGAAGRKSEPAPVSAPVPEIEIPAESPVAAAQVPGEGAASTAGAAATGSGTGAGGSGAGRGGGGTGGGAGRPTGAVKISGGLSQNDYRQFARLGIAAGQADLILLVDPRGRASNCRPFRSSGSAEIDRLICVLLENRLRFRPARDALGRAIYQDVHYVAFWSN